MEVGDALREVKLIKETEDTKIGAVFHRLDDAFDKSFFNVEGSSVQPIIKKVDPGSMAESAGLVPGDVVLSVNGISGLSTFQVVEMLRKGHGVFNLVVISGRQVQQQLNAAQQAEYLRTLDVSKNARGLARRAVDRARHLGHAEHPRRRGPLGRQI